MCNSGSNLKSKFFHAFILMEHGSTTSGINNNLFSLINNTNTAKQTNLIKSYTCWKANLFR